MHASSPAFVRVYRPVQRVRVMVSTPRGCTVLWLGAWDWLLELATLRAMLDPRFQSGFLAFSEEGDTWTDVPD